MSSIFDVEVDWRLTPEEIRACKGFENATDDDVEYIISTFSLLTRALCESDLSELNKDCSSE